MLASRYKITKIIGEGASSTVYRACDTLNGSEVAIKAVASMHSIESEILKNIQSEHIIKLQDIIKEEKITYLILELCEYDLISFINEHFVDARCLKKIMRMILIGLKDLHDRKIIHRDIKLSNILVKDGCVKICDFGMSCYADKNDYAYCGTKDYLAPEILKGFYTEKIDIFAAGVILKSLITRKKGVEIGNIRNIDRITFDFIKSLLNIDPDLRLSVEEALQHPVFDELYINIPDFRLLKGFTVKTKYGEIMKSDAGYAEVIYDSPVSNAKNALTFADSNSKYKNQDSSGKNFHYSSLNSRKSFSKIKIEYFNEKCNCKEPYSFRLSVNDNHANRNFLYETELKYYNYLCSYLSILCDKTPKIKISDKNFDFVYFLSGLFAFTKGDLTISKHHGFYKINSENHTTVPFIYKNEIDNLERRCEIECYEKCICGGIFSREADSTINVSLASEKQAEKCEFIASLGWCIKDKKLFKFFLNSGCRFAINCEDQILIVDNRGILINENIDFHLKEYLKIARQFLSKFV